LEAEADAELVASTVSARWAALGFGPKFARSMMK
jgi:hypothetical protein